MLFKDAEVIVEGKCAPSIGKGQFSLNKLHLDKEEKLLLMSSASPFLFGSFQCIGATCSAVSAFSTTAAATGISAFESCILKNELMKKFKTDSLFILCQTLRI